MAQQLTQRTAANKTPKDEPLKSPATGKPLLASVANNCCGCCSLPCTIRVLLRVALCFVLAIVINAKLGAWNDESIERQLRETKQINYFDVNGLNLMYRCVAPPTTTTTSLTKTVWIVHGVSASWLVQSPPVHRLHEQLRDAQVCSYARPGRAFTTRSTADFTVDEIIEQLHALIVGVTPKNHKIILVGHS